MRGISIGSGIPSDTELDEHRTVPPAVALAQVDICVRAGQSGWLELLAIALVTAHSTCSHAASVSAVMSGCLLFKLVSKAVHAISSPVATRRAHVKVWFWSCRRPAALSKTILRCSGTPRILSTVIGANDSILVIADRILQHLVV